MNKKKKIKMGGMDGGADYHDNNDVYFPVLILKKKKNEEDFFFYYNDQHKNQLINERKLKKRQNCSAVEKDKIERMEEEVTELYHQYNKNN